MKQCLLIVALSTMFLVTNTFAQPFAWSALGGGADNGEVLALATDGVNVYAGGSFTSIGGVSANRIAKWDGSTWSPMGDDTGNNGTVMALAVDANGVVYAGGDFLGIGGVWAERLAKWDGTTWSILGREAMTDGTVWSLAVDGGNVYAGGDFGVIGGVWASRIAKWNGTDWLALPEFGFGGPNATVASIAVDSVGNVYAGGAFTTWSEAPMNGVAKWNGTDWSALGAGAIGDVYTIAVKGSDVYVGGDCMFPSVGYGYGIAKWDGNFWSGLSTGTDASPVTSIVVNDSDVYAGGWFSSIGGVSVDRIAKWTGSIWQPIGTPGTNGVSGDVVLWMVKQPATNSMIVGGNFTGVNGMSGGQNIAKFTDGNNILPIQLASFTGAYLNNAVVLQWMTLSEINNYGFEIQRSADSTNYQSIPGTLIPGHGTTNTPQHYSYTDSTVASGAWYYRLKQIDLDGAVHYSDGVHVNTVTDVKEAELPTVFSLSQNYPNPFNPTSTIRYGLPLNAFVTLTVYNALGQQVAQLVNEQQSTGYHDVVFRADGLASGMYLYRIQAGNFSSVKRLLLLK